MSACQHDSLSGDEGPISELGRWPLRWRCDECGAVINELSSDASASASDERPGTSLTPPEVEVPGLPNTADTTIAQACERIDLLEQEVEALQRENARLRSWLGAR